MKNHMINARMAGILYFLGTALFTLLMGISLVAMTAFYTPFSEKTVKSLR